MALLNVIIKNTFKIQDDAIVISKASGLILAFQWWCMIFPCISWFLSNLSCFQSSSSSPSRWAYNSTSLTSCGFQLLSSDAFCCWAVFHMPVSTGASSFTKYLQILQFSAGLSLIILGCNFFTLYISVFCVKYMFWDYLWITVLFFL